MRASMAWETRAVEHVRRDRVARQIERHAVSEFLEAAEHLQWPVGGLAPQPLNRLRQHRGMRSEGSRTGAMDGERDRRGERDHQRTGT